MSAILGETWPDVFKSIGIHSGLGAGAAHNGPTAFEAMRGDGITARPLTLPAMKLAWVILEIIGKPGCVPVAFASARDC